MLWLPLLLVVAAASSPAPATAPPAGPHPPPGRDSDGDGISDADEDTNHNGVVDPGESDPNHPDTDRDNVPDDVERRLGSDPNDANDVPPIPEPLYLDLVRNLGSRRGELEVNVLAATSFRRSPAVSWGPEIEYSPLPGLGLELEVPLTDRVEAIKPGAQLTLGSLAARRLDVGVLGTYEQHLHTPSSFTTVSMVTGIRFLPHVTAITIVGPTVALARNNRPTFGALLSPSIFYQASRTITLGLEVGFRIDGDRRSEQLALPQVHFNVDSHVKVQLGVGVAHAADEFRPFSAIRVCWEK